MAHWPRFKTVRSTCSCLKSQKPQIWSNNSLRLRSRNHNLYRKPLQPLKSQARFIKCQSSCNHKSIRNRSWERVLIYIIIRAQQQCRRNPSRRRPNQTRWVWSRVWAMKIYLLIFMTKRWIIQQQPLFNNKTTICLSWPKECLKTSNCNKKRAIRQIRIKCRWWYSSMNSSYHNWKAKYRHSCTRTNRWKTVRCSKRSHSTNTSSRSSSYKTRFNRIKSPQMLSSLKSVRLIITSRRPSLKSLMRQNRHWSISNLKPNKCRSSYNSKTKKWPRLSIIV